MLSCGWPAGFSLNCLPKLMNNWEKRKHNFEQIQKKNRKNIEKLDKKMRQIK